MICHWILTYPTAVLGIWHPVWNCWKLLETFKTQIKWTNKGKNLKKIQKQLSFFMSFKKHFLANECVVFFSLAQPGAFMIACAKNPVMANISKPLNVAISLKQKSLHGHEPWHQSINQNTSELAFPNQEAWTLPLWISNCLQRQILYHGRTSFCRA